MKEELVIVMKQWEVEMAQRYFGGTMDLDGAIGHLDGTVGYCDGGMMSLSRKGPKMMRQDCITMQRWGTSVAQRDVVMGK